jgi:hypothetical protein
MSPFIRQIAFVSAHITLGSWLVCPVLRAQAPSNLIAHRPLDAMTTERGQRSYHPRPMTIAQADTAPGRPRRAVVAGAIVGALFGGVGTAAYVLNATASECITLGPPCPHKDYTFLNTVSIAAGTAAGVYIGAKVGGWIATRARH